MKTTTISKTNFNRHKHKITNNNNSVVEFELKEHNLDDEGYPNTKWHTLILIIKAGGRLDADTHTEISLVGILPQGIDKMISDLEHINETLKRATNK